MAVRKDRSLQKALKPGLGSYETEENESKEKERTTQPTQPTQSKKEETRSGANGPSARQSIDKTDQQARCDSTGSTNQTRGCVDARDSNVESE
jgi:hypothetical protein